ncbi:hypothetical protein QLQ12_33585 [Actinoplanes sp. NEAU-A12]|uniref:ESX-1 secretion-associated protein n=1 Tax=Actinoplanes sandaracinus TaxID=3045177 RepID=A0ABT6WUY2_9ACTN|nr:hypothetical protein [Actinoplanes sandaracinus]MDI6103555.1 hypothetical protein [Actinoplanes sandaracinus]
MTQPSEQQVTVAIDALHEESNVWATMATQTEAMTGATRSLSLSTFDFSALGYATGLDSIYLELQERIARLLEQAAANFTATAQALKSAADAYQREEDRNMHAIKNTY